MKFGTNEIIGAYLGTVDMTKIYLGVNPIYEKGGTYRQQWSDNQPSQHNTPVPVDSVGLATGFVSATSQTVFETASGSGNIGLETGFVSVSVQNV